MRGLGLSVCVWWAGCAGGGGGGYCERVAEHAEECAELADFTDSEVQACEEQSSVCTAEEQDAMVAFFDCIVDLSPCDATSEPTVTSGAAFACFAELDSLSEECLAAGATTTAYVTLP
jgi:hypothetical protein